VRCTNCNIANSGAGLFCRSCGHSILANEIVECENHSGTTATGVCTVCGKPVCDDCSLSREGKIYCDDVKHSQLFSTFTRLAFAATEFEADLIAKNLEPSGISVLLYSAKAYAHFCRLTDEERISVYVNTEKTDEAKRLLAENDLTEFLSIEKTPP